MPPERGPPLGLANTRSTVTIKSVVGIGSELGSLPFTVDPADWLATFPITTRSADCFSSLSDEYEVAQLASRVACVACPEEVPRGPSKTSSAVVRAARHTTAHATSAIVRLERTLATVLGIMVSLRIRITPSTGR